MTEESRQAGHDLVAALREMVAVKEEQTRQAESARLHSEQVREKFQRLLDARRAGAGVQEADAAIQEDILHARCRDRLDEIRHTEQLSRKREEAFLDAQEALMRLYADPAARDATGDIAAILRALRLLNFEGRLEAPPALEPPPLPPVDDPQARETWKLDVFQGFSATMDAWHTERRKELEELMERSDALLRQALAQAENLARRTLG